MYHKTIDDLVNDQRKKLVIDMRKPAEFAKETYPESVNLPLAVLEAKAADNDFSDIPKELPVYLLCYTELKSDELAKRLIAAGYDNVYSIVGGFSAYMGYKLKLDLEEQEKLEQRWKEEALAAERDGKISGSHANARSGLSSCETQAAAFKENAEPTSGNASDRTPDSVLRPASDGESETTQYASDSTEKKKKKPLTRCQQVERSIVKKFKKEIWRCFTKAINEYNMIQDGDKIAVCISGGKDSMLMAKLFQELERHGKKNFDVVYLVMNPGYNDINYQTILDNSKLLGIPITVFKSQIFDTVADITENPCYLCARMRRGYLYSKARELGCNKIALGHHFDDVIETIVMGMMYGGQVQTMMPKLHSTNFEGMELIRPLYLIRERDIIHWAEYNELHFIRCACRFTEQCATAGETDKGSKRAEVKELIRQLEAVNPYIPKNIFRSVENVNLSTVIAYKQHGVVHHFLDTYEDVTGNDSDE